MYQSFQVNIDAIAPAYTNRYKSNDFRAFFFFSSLPLLLFKRIKLVKLVCFKPNIDTADDNRIKIQIINVYIFTVFDEQLVK